MNESQFNLSSFKAKIQNDENTLNTKEFLYCADKCLKVEQKDLTGAEKNCLNNCYNLVTGSKLI